MGDNVIGQGDCGFVSVPAIKQYLRAAEIAGVDYIPMLRAANIMVLTLILILNMVVSLYGALQAPKNEKVSSSPTTARLIRPLFWSMAMVQPWLFSTPWRIS